MTAITQEQQQLLFAMQDCRMDAMVGLLRQQFESPEIYAAMSFETRMADLIASFRDEQQRRRCETLLRQAKLKMKLELREIVTSAARGFKDELRAELASLRWTTSGNIHNIICIGGTGMGKTALLCALGRQCCRQGISVWYTKYATLAEALSESAATRQTTRRHAARCGVLIIDDFGSTRPNDVTAALLLELLDERYQEKPVLLGTQLTQKGIQQCSTNAPTSEAISRRLLEKAYVIQLKANPCIPDLGNPNSPEPKQE